MIKILFTMMFAGKVFVITCKYVRYLCEHKGLYKLKGFIGYAEARTRCYTNHADCSFCFLVRICEFVGSRTFFTRYDMGNHVGDSNLANDALVTKKVE